MWCLIIKGIVSDRFPVKIVKIRVHFFIHVLTSPTTVKALKEGLIFTFKEEIFMVVRNCWIFFIRPTC